MEIVVRAAVIFAFLWLVTRAVGKRELGQMNTFELLMIVTMGDLVQQGVTQEDYSLTGAMLAVGTFALLSVTLSYVTWRFRRTRPVIEGVPTVVLERGRFLDQVLSYERLPVEEVLEAMRQQGIRDPAEVELAVLEPDGSYSFFPSRSADGGGDGESNRPAQ